MVVAAGQVTGYLPTQNPSTADAAWNGLQQANSASQTLYRLTTNAQARTSYEPVQVPLPPPYNQVHPTQHQQAAHVPVPFGQAVGRQDLLTDIRIAAHPPVGRGSLIDKVSMPMDPLDNMVPKKCGTRSGRESTWIWRPSCSRMNRRWSCVSATKQIGRPSRWSLATRSTLPPSCSGRRPSGGTPLFSSGNSLTNMRVSSSTWTLFLSWLKMRRIG